MPHYDDTLTLGEGRDLYFQANGLGEGGYADRWVRLMAGPLPIYFPNSQARVRALKLHDLHHLLTEYDTTWVGEAEIAAWELTSGCARHYPAWLLNLNGMAIGLFLNPRKVFEAYRRGRQSRCLYQGEFHQEMLAQRLGAMRTELGLRRAAAPPRAGDNVGFAAWCVFSLATFAVTVGLSIVPVALVLLLATRLLLS